MESSLASLSDAGSRASLSGASSLVSSLAPSSVNIPLVPPRPVDTLASRSQSDSDGSQSSIRGLVNEDDYKSYGELLESGKTPMEASILYSRQFDNLDPVDYAYSDGGVGLEGSEGEKGNGKGIPQGIPRRF